MYLSKKFADDLKRLGFKRTYYVDEVAPFDYYFFEDEEWVLGGRILPKGEILVHSDVYEKGIWLPSINDLLFWLSDNNFSVLLEQKERTKGYKVVVTDINHNSFSGKGGTCVYALYDVIQKILKNNF